ncbi:hypothetical protein Pcinc_022317 [Petrolisthes cinctipes]|uniref:Uncharacterized protein n=1 Tax=Petrolisthes cinctipes TaxID=88211 RepID=A0AAE1KDW1_PETCI|nr:hypothetical protein Pcinc_022317 [Petrolisthes cinctipes]
MPLRPQPLTQTHPHSFHPGSGHGLILQMERHSVPPQHEEQQEPQQLPRQVAQQVEDFPQLFQQIQKQLGSSGKQQGSKSFPQNQYQPSSASPDFASPTAQALPNPSHSPSTSTLHSSPSAPQIPTPTSLFPAIIQPLNAPPQPPPSTVQAQSEACYRERNVVESLSSKQSTSNDATLSHPLSNFMETGPRESRGQPYLEHTPRSGESSNIMIPPNQATSEGAYVDSETATSGKPTCRQAEAISNTSGAQLSIPLGDESSTLDDLESTLGSVSSFPDGPVNSQSEREEDSNQSGSQNDNFPDSRPPGAFCIDSLLSDSTQKSPSRLPKIAFTSSVNSVLEQENITLPETSTTENSQQGKSQIQASESDSNDVRSVDETSQSSHSRMENTALKRPIEKDSTDMKNYKNSAIPDMKKVDGESSNRPENEGSDDSTTKGKRSNESSDQSIVQEESEKAKETTSKEVKNPPEENNPPNAKTEEKVSKESPVPVEPQGKEIKAQKSNLSALKMCRVLCRDRFKLSNLEERGPGAPLGPHEDSATGRGQSLVGMAENLTGGDRQISDKESSIDSFKETSQSQLEKDEGSLTKEGSLDSSKEDSQSSEKEGNQSSAKDGKKSQSLSIKPLKDLMAPEAEKPAKKTRKKRSKRKTTDTRKNLAIVQMSNNLLLTHNSNMTSPIFTTPSLPGTILLPGDPAMTTSIAFPTVPSLAPSILLSQHPTTEADTVSGATGSNTPPTDDPLAIGDKKGDINFVDVKYIPESENLRESSNPLNPDPFMMEDIKPSVLIPEVVLKTEPEDAEDPSCDDTEDSWNHHSVDIPTTMEESVADDSNTRQEETTMMGDDVTHFFEPNERQFVDGQPLKVTCHVCEVNVTSRLFKHHLFFGHLQCQYCNRKLVGCDMLIDIKSFKKNVCSRSVTKQHCFRRWSLDPIEFLSYYIRKELVIDRFCAGKQGPPPVSDIILEIERYIGRLSDLAVLSPWKLAIAKCYKYINERKPGGIEGVSGTLASSSSDTRRVWPVANNSIKRTNSFTVTTVSNSTTSTTLDVLPQMHQKVKSNVARGGTGGETSIQEQEKSLGPAGAERSQWAESLQHQNTKKVKGPPNISCSCSRALTEAILKTVFPRQPSNDYYMVTHYPTHPVPESCPACYAQLDPTTVSVNASTHVITAQCLDCNLAIYIAQDPPGTLDPSQSKRKNSPASSSITPPPKVAKFS